MYAGHQQLFIVSEKVAKRGVSGFLDNSLRDNEMRLDFNVVVARGTRAEDLLKLYTPLEKLPTQSMLRSLETSEKSWAPTISVTMDDILATLSSEGKELALTGIQLLGDKQMAQAKENVETFRPPSHFRYTGVAVFKKDKLIGWLTERESKGFTDITDNLDSTSVELPCDDNSYVGIEITTSQSRIRMEEAGGRPEAHVQFRTEANVVDRGCKSVDLTDPATIEKLQKQVADVMRGNAEAAVKKAQQLKSDIFGFGLKLGQQKPAFWQKIREDWNDRYFPELKVNYHIDVFIRKTGTTRNSTIH